MIHFEKHWAVVIVETGLKWLDKGRAVVDPGLRNKLLAAAGPFTPRVWLTLISARLLGLAQSTSKPPIVVRNEILIHAAPERVWDLLTDVEHWPSWYRACRWVRLSVAPIPTFPQRSWGKECLELALPEATQGVGRVTEFQWKAHPVTLQSTVTAADRPRIFAFVADTPGIHAERTFTLRPAPAGVGTVFVSYETQVGFLAKLGRLYLGPRLHAANQTMFADLARAVEHGGVIDVIPAAG